MTVKRCTAYSDGDTLTIRRFDPIPPGQSPESREKCVRTENANLRRQNTALREENLRLREQAAHDREKIERLKARLLELRDELEMRRR